MRRIIAILSLLIVALASAPTVSAGIRWQEPIVVASSEGTQGGCGVDPSRVLLYENRIGDTSDNDDRLWVCSNTTVLPDHTLPGDCQSVWPNEATWNVCVSSFAAYLPAHTRLCFYAGTNYGSTKIDQRQNTTGSTIYIPRVNIAMQDRLVSLRWMSTSYSC